MERRDYAGQGDLLRMQDLVQRMWSPERRFHIGDLAWGRYSIPGAEEDFRTSLWEHEGRLVAWAWAELPGHVEVVTEDTSLLPEMLSWFERTAAGPELSCLVMDGDGDLLRTLETRGYQSQEGGPYFTRHARELVELPPVELHEGFTIQPVPDGEAARRAAAHRAGWSDFGSRVSAESYAAVMNAYPYRSETDLVVAAPDGEWVASALGWYDEVNLVGLVEPVSCHPGYRRRGLARAVNIALLHAFRHLGGTSAVVLPRGDDAYPAPGQLYRNIGYRPQHRTVLYSRQVV